MLSDLIYLTFFVTSTVVCPRLIPDLYNAITTVLGGIFGCCWSGCKRCSKKGSSLPPYSLRHRAQSAKMFSSSAPTLEGDYDKPVVKFSKRMKPSVFIDTTYQAVADMSKVEIPSGILYKKAPHSDVTEQLKEAAGPEPAFNCLSRILRTPSVLQLSEVPQWLIIKSQFRAHKHANMHRQRWDNEYHVPPTQWSNACSVKG